MFTKGELKSALKVDAAVSGEMQTAIDLWWAMFRDEAPWLNEETKSMSLPASIAGELARLTTVELESRVSGSLRAEYLEEQYRHFLTRLRPAVEFAAAGGGVVFKPYVDGKRIAVDCVPAGRFVPTASNSRGEITGAVFVEQAQKGRQFFTRLEHHALTDQGYFIRNYAFRSWSREVLGTQVGLDEVDEWSGLEPELILQYRDGTAPERPLFAYFRLPFANHIDESTPLGVSAYSRAAGLVREADRQYSRILWEYEGSELAVDASVGAIAKDEHGKFKLPQGKRRLFRELGIDKGSGDLYEVFSPAIRDSSLFNGLNQLLRRIEFNCYLSYGTLSDPQNVDKTAEEVKMSKQRSYSAVREMQRALQGALEDLVWAMDFYTGLYKLAPNGEYEVSFVWGDGILADSAAEFLQLKGLADSGYLRPEKLLARYFGVTEEEALEYLPQESPPMFE